jgi:hypothetical protein
MNHLIVQVETLLEQEMNESSQTVSLAYEKMKKLKNKMIKDFQKRKTFNRSIKRRNHYIKKYP